MNDKKLLVHFSSLLVVMYLKRIANHTTYMAETVIYIALGEH